jgi:aspartokinase
MKFGGTSMGSPDSLKNVTDIIRLNLNEKPIVVVSAVSGTTDILIEIANLALKSTKGYQQKLSDLKTKHFQIVEKLFPLDSNYKLDCLEILNEKF